MMILNNSKISARQLNRLILTAGSGTLMMLLPDVAGSGETGIASLFVAFVITLLHLKFVFWLVEKSRLQAGESGSIEEQNSKNQRMESSGSEGTNSENQRISSGSEGRNSGSESKSSRMILILAAVIEFVKCLALSAGFLLAAANTVRTILLPGKSFLLVAAVWLVGAVYLACAGTEARGRYAEAVWLIALVPLVFLLLLCLAHIGKHGSITEGALISIGSLKNNVAGILFRGILYSAVFAPVELIYWCRDKIAWDVSTGQSSKNHEFAMASPFQNDEDRQKHTMIQNGWECSELSKVPGLSETDDVNRESAVIRTRAAYRKTECAIMAAVCIVFIFAILFTAAAVGILGIQGIQATEHSAMAIAAGLDVMGAIVAQKQGIAVLFFLTGMLTASGVLLGQMVRFGWMTVEKITERRNDRHNYNRGGGDGRKNHVISLCMALLIWCTAAGIYNRYVNSPSGEQTAGYENTSDRTGAEVSLNTTAQIEDRAYCTAIGIDLAGEFENTQFYDETDENGSAQNTAEESETEKKSTYLFTLEIAQGSDMEASFVICEADSLAEAASIFNANSNRELDVSHLQILLLGNSLLESECYKNVLLEFGEASEYYFGGTLLAFTSETANEYMENYADSYDSEGTAVGLHLKKRFEQGLVSEKAVLGTVYYRWINHEEEEPAEWIPTLTLD